MQVAVKELLLPTSLLPSQLCFKYKTMSRGGADLLSIRKKEKEIYITSNGAACKDSLTWNSKKQLFGLSQGT